MNIPEYAILSIIANVSDELNTADTTEQIVVTIPAPITMQDNLMNVNFL